MKGRACWIRSVRGEKDPPTDARPPRRNRAAGIVAAEGAAAAAANGRDRGAGGDGHATRSSRFHRVSRGGSGHKSVAPGAPPLMQQTGGGQRDSGWRWEQRSGGWHPPAGGGGSGEKRKVGRVGECAAPPRPSPRPLFLPLHRRRALWRRRRLDGVGGTLTCRPCLPLPSPLYYPWEPGVHCQSPTAAVVLDADAPAAERAWPL